MAKSKLAGKVQTVLGAIDPKDMGVTLGHEHLLIDLTCYVQTPDEATLRRYRDLPTSIDLLGKFGAMRMYNRDNYMLLDVDAAIEEVSRFRQMGGGTVVDTTSIGIGRDPPALARISRATGLHVVMGGSYYVPVSYAPGTDKKGEDDFAGEIIRDITVGVGDTGIRSGLIGEVGCFHPLSETEKRVLRGSAMAQKATGCPISIHPGFAKGSPMEIINILTKAGADPRNVVMGHISTAMKDRGALLDLAQTGCYIQDDVFAFEDTAFEYRGMSSVIESDVQRMERIAFLIERGYGGRVLVGQDVCHTWQYLQFGGRGFAHILTSIVPRMRKRGFTQQHIDDILVHNPARAFAFK